MRAICIGSVVLLILCAASLALARWQNAPPQSDADAWRRPNGYMSNGWREAHAHWQKQASIRPIVQQGEQAMAQGRYAEAEGLFRKALGIFPQDAMALLRLAEVCERQDKQAEALRAYHELIYPQGWGSNINSDPTTYMRYVLALTRSGQWQEAVAVYEKAMQRVTQTDRKVYLYLHFDPGVVDRSGLQAAAHYVLGTRYPTFGPADPAEQREHLGAAVRLRPRWALAQFAYGRALAEAGRLNEAKAAYSRAASLAGGDLKPQVQKALEEMKARENRK
jgi:tetratricopeptide (TPR) repeat protein